MSDIHKMSLSSLLGQIDSIKDNSASFLPSEGKQDPDKKIWQDDVDACNAATEIYTLSLHDALPISVKKDGVWHCPDCNHRVNPHHSHCHWCGTRLLGGALK